jgi:hypothetical protein
MKHQVAIGEPENYLGPSDLVAVRCFWVHLGMSLCVPSGSWKANSNPYNVLADTELEMELSLCKCCIASGDNNK